MIEKMKKERTRLEGELKKGRQMLVEMQQKVNNLTANMQRIQGAMQFINSQLEPQNVPNMTTEKPETRDESK